MDILNGENAVLFKDAFPLGGGGHLQRPLRMKVAGAIPGWFLVLTLALHLSCGEAGGQLVNESCPLDFRILDRYPWPIEPCSGAPGPLTETSPCCEAILSRFGLLTSLYLRVTGNFELSDTATAKLCLLGFDAKLQRQGLPAGIVPGCLSNASMFTSNADLCQGILTTRDFEEKLGASNMRNSCNGNLLDPAKCRVCNLDMSIAVVELTNLGTRNSRCLAFVVIYAAGVANVEGPYNYGAAECMLGVNVSFVTEHGKHLGLELGVGAGCIGVVSLFVAFLVLLWCRRRQQRVHQRFVERNSKMLKPHTGLVWFSFEEIKAVTKNFSEKQMIGEGGFGKVYRAYMEDLGMDVAVKKFKSCCPETDGDFRSEVEGINIVRHRNLVVLRGCCIASSRSDGHQRLLIYDYMPNGSLYDYLFGKKMAVLSWPDRQRIAIGIAKGIKYLHEELQPAMIHRDIKSSNILLDANLEAHVGDFGLAKTITQLANASGLHGHIAGTHGYVAPEYSLYGNASEKSDVYSFGVVLLELISGRRAVESSNPHETQLIVDWAWALVKENKLSEILDVRIRPECPQDVTHRFVQVGMLCAHPLVALRPRMGDVLKMLLGDVAIPHVPDGFLHVLSPRSILDTPPAYVVGSGLSLQLASQQTVDTAEVAKPKQQMDVHFLQGR